MGGEERINGRTFLEYIIYIHKTVKVRVFEKDFVLCLVC